MFNLEKYHLRQAAVTGVVIGAATAGYSIYQGEKQKSEAKKAMNNLDQQALENVYEDIPISRVGSDYLAEQNSRTTSQALAASRNAGIRGVLSAVPRIQAMANDLNRDEQVYLDNQVQERNRLIADDNRRIQGMQEQRYNQELAGIGNQLAVGQVYTDQGIRGLGNAAMMASTLDYGNNRDDDGYSGLSNKEMRLARREIRRSLKSKDGLADNAYMSSVPELADPSKSLYDNYKPDSYGLG